ncbi:MAG: UDP-3-O-(3-hydroxymyristoyl)glucosamine N-acyltransferase [Planctomycetes bacterium]|nr:UDP-3-O-(3-hydroxymyristoyl)glucosamine N-acyltransferase [Planctomycetota bacterium]
MKFCAPAPENDRPLSATEVALMLDGTLDGDGNHAITGVSELAAAVDDQASYWLPRSSVGGCAAGLVLVPQEAELPEELMTRPARVAVARPDLAAALLAQHFDLARPRWTGVHERAFIDPTATLGEGCTVHAGAWIGPGCKLGAGCEIHPNVVVEAGTLLGIGCTVHANSVLGADGFGYVWSGSKHEKVPQQGCVEVGDGVEIGACTTIDRGTYGVTVIGDGCILDNQVQIGHNCVLGRFVVLCAQVGLAGSTTIGDGAVLGGRAASSGHLHIGAGVRMAGAAVATKDIPDGLTVGGYPAWELTSETRAIARLRRLIRESRS